MAAIETTRAAHASSGNANRRPNTINALFGAVRSWNDARLTRKALYGLSDRELEDIGLARGDIEAVVAKRL